MIQVVESQLRYDDDEMKINIEDLDLSIPIDGTTDA